ncbi:Clathrin light chain [Malassezia yamatoensis]|uniref:Clathrin light chain n=1 Tax=Malassezia yamatoensis TaxID=253288 RepID=A0AAJ6CG32_9BASI|nr:Clathrin light chain [Malassezia yamatoensis]
MAFDFGQLGDNESLDPTSDFLQRERQAAGAILGDDETLFGSGSNQQTQEHDFEQAAQGFPALDDEDQFQDSLTGAIDDPVVPARDLPSDSIPTRVDSLAEFGSEPEVRPESARANSMKESYEIDAHQDKYQPEQDTGFEAEFEANYPETTQLESGVVPNSSSSAPARDSYDAQDMTHSNKPTPFSYENLDEESGPVQEWREKQNEEIARRDAHAERLRAEAASKAEQEIDQFYAKYNEEKEKNIRKNKEAEARFLEQKQVELAEGTTWTRITKLLDLQNSQSRTIAKTHPGSSNLNRMKELYLSLRREGETAPGAAGY